MPTPLRYGVLREIRWLAIKVGLIRLVVSALELPVSAARRAAWHDSSEPLADYLLDENPQAGAKIRVDVDGKGLKIADF